MRSQRTGPDDSTDPQPAILAAEIAAGEGEFNRAEDALLAALSRVRRQRWTERRKRARGGA